MTIRYNCRQCRNSGVYRVYVRKALDLRVDLKALTEIPEFNVITQEKYCDCEIGKERQVWDNRMAHPEYENPLTKMSDEELLSYLTLCSARDELREKLIDEEFNI